MVPGKPPQKQEKRGKKMTEIVDALNIIAFILGGIFGVLLGIAIVFCIAQKE